MITRKTNAVSRIPAAILALVAVIVFGLIIYLALFVSSRYWAHNTNDGPGEAYDQAFAPVAAVVAVKPTYWADALLNGGSLEVYVEQVNEGNGYVYFQYKGRPHRAYYGGSLSSAHSESHQLLKFSATTFTDDAFQSKLIVTANLAETTDSQPDNQ